MRKRLLDAREAVWRAWFGGDRAALEKLIPQETIAIESGDNNWSNRQKIRVRSVCKGRRQARKTRVSQD
jgi:hypothetical protein